MLLAGAAAQWGKGIGVDCLPKDLLTLIFTAGARSVHGGVRLWIFADSVKRVRLIGGSGQTNSEWGRRRLELKGRTTYASPPLEHGSNPWHAADAVRCPDRLFARMFTRRRNRKFEQGLGQCRLPTRNLQRRVPVFYDSESRGWSASVNLQTCSEVECRVRDTSNSGTSFTTEHRRQPYHPGRKRRAAPLRHRRTFSRTGNCSATTRLGKEEYRPTKRPSRCICNPQIPCFLKR